MKATKRSRSRVAPEESSLCQFPFADGRTCRMLRHSSHPSLCVFHAHQEQQLLELDRIDAELASLSGGFKTESDINHVLGKLFKLVAANRIPTRTARLLAYLSQLLLYTHKGVRHEMTSVQDYEAWDNILRAIYPAVPRKPRPAPLPPSRLSPPQAQPRPQEAQDGANG